MAKKTKSTAAPEDDSVSRIMALFRGYGGSSGTHGMPDLDPNGLKWAIKKTARTINEGPTRDMWKQHLAGTRPLGVVPVLSDNMCMWGSIDIDKYNIDLLEIIARVEAMKLPLVPCRSKSGGLHLFLFCTEPVQASLVLLALRNVAAMIGHAESEIFPKQTSIKDGDKGSWMVMPYYGDTFGGKLQFQYGLKKTGAEQTLEEFLHFAEKMRVTPEQLLELRRSSTQPDSIVEKNGKKREKKPFGDGPPCLQYMSEAGFPEGGRNQAMLNVGTYLKRAYPGNWKEVMSDYNVRFFKPPLPANEVSELQKNLDKKDYEYTCKAAPLCNHCDSITCRTRRFGVGSDAYPEILAMRKVLTEPAIYFVDVLGLNGETVTLETTTEQLQYFSKFQGLCMEHAHVVQKDVPQKIWTSILHDAFSKADLIPAPPDVSPGGRFKELLETYCVNRNNASQKEDLLRDAAWEDEERGRYWFTVEGLQKHLERESIKMNRSQIWASIRKLHGKTDSKFHPKEFMNIKGRGVNAWWIPSNSIQKMPEIPPPPLPKEKL